MKCPSCLGMNKDGCPTCYKTIHILPQDPGEHDIDLARSFCIVTPTRGQNFVENPTLRPPGYVGTSNQGFFTTGAGTTATYVTNVDAPFGGTTVQITPGVAVAGTGMFQTFSTLATPIPGLSQQGRSYVYSLYFRGTRGATYELGISNEGAPLGTGLIAHKNIVANGQWQRVEVPYTETVANQRRAFYFRTIAPIPDPGPILVTGLQLEFQNPNHPGKASTYIDGPQGFDWPGFQSLPDGIPHRFLGAGDQSDSVRSRFTYSGGHCVSLEDCGFIVEGISGWNMAVGERITQRYATLDGSYHQGYKYGDSVSTISGRWLFCDPSMNDMMCARNCLVEAFGHPERKCRDLQLMRYQPYDDCGNECGEPLDVIGSFIGGLEGEITNCGIQTRAVLQFERKPEVLGPVRVIERVFSPTITPNITNHAADAVGPLDLRIAYCYRGAIATSPWWTFYVERANMAGASITNLDTGERIAFRVNNPLVLVNEFLVLVTEPTQSRLRAYNPTTNVFRDVTGFLEPGSHISSFQFIPGINNIQYLVPAADGVTNPPGTNNNILGNRRPNNMQMRWRERYLGISGACCAKRECDESLVRDGFSLAVVGGVPYT